MSDSFTNLPQFSDKLIARLLAMLKIRSCVASLRDSSPGHFSFAHDENAIAHAKDFRHFGRDHDNRRAAAAIR
jgi:hypothetical protein